MTAKEAARKVNSKHPDRAAKKAFSFKGGFLILAPAKSLGESEDLTNPYFFVSSSGEVRGFSPLDDLDAFANLKEVPI